MFCIDTICIFTFWCLHSYTPYYFNFTSICSSWFAFFPFWRGGGEMGRFLIDATKQFLLLIFPIIAWLKPNTLTYVIPLYYHLQITARRISIISTSSEDSGTAVDVDQVFLSAFHSCLLLTFDILLFTKQIDLSGTADCQDRNSQIRSVVLFTGSRSKTNFFLSFRANWIAHCGQCEWD